MCGCKLVGVEVYIISIEVNRRSIAVGTSVSPQSSGWAFLCNQRLDCGIGIRGGFHVHQHLIFASILSCTDVV